MADEELEYPERGYNTRDVRAQRDEDPKPRRSRRWLWITLAALFLAPAALMALWATITLNYDYSRGERVGYLQKFSEKGWICKTWEGELAMATIPGSAPQLFYFSVRDDAVAAEISRIMQTREGRISLSYEEHRGVPTSCFGETDYYVTGARPVGPEGSVVPAAPGTTTLPPGTTVPAPAAGAATGATVPAGAPRTP